MVVLRFNTSCSHLDSSGNEPRPNRYSSGFLCLFQGIIAGFMPTEAQSFAEAGVEATQTVNN